MRLGRLHQLFISSTLFVVGSSLVACSFDPEAPAPYQDGERLLTETGAFHVELWNASGETQVGANDFVLHVAMPNPNAPTELGWGIPDAHVHVDAYMPYADHEMPTDAQVAYLGDGQYILSGVNLDREGTWVLDVEIAVGQSIDDHVEFALEL